MSPPMAVLEAGSGTLGRLPCLEAHDWTDVVARHAGDDWPPPEWLAVMAGGGNDPHSAPSFSMPTEERAAA